MSKYIDVDKLQETVCKRVNNPAIRGWLNSLINEQPAADAVEVRHGKWQPCYEDWRKQIEGDECSACGFRHYGTNIRNYPYCPNCGARMDGKDGETNDG